MASAPRPLAAQLMGETRGFAGLSALDAAGTERLCAALLHFLKATRTPGFLAATPDQLRLQQMSGAPRRPISCPSVTAQL